MRVLICGGRNYKDKDYVYAMLDRERELAWLTSRQELVICHGGASGADKLAGQWAKDRNISCTVFPAKWKIYGRAAGPIRNTQMLSEFKPDKVIAFPGGKGTADMIRQAKIVGIAVKRINYDLV